MSGNEALRKSPLPRMPKDIQTQYHLKIKTHPALRRVEVGTGGILPLGQLLFPITENDAVFRNKLEDDGAKILG